MAPKQPYMPWTEAELHAQQRTLPALRGFYQVSNTVWSPHWNIPACLLRFTSTNTSFDQSLCLKKEWKPLTGKILMIFLEWAEGNKQMFKYWLTVSTINYSLSVLSGVLFNNAWAWQKCLGLWAFWKFFKTLAVLSVRYLMSAYSTLPLWQD